MKAFYTERTEDQFGKPIYKVWDYFKHQPICTIVVEGPARTREYYAEKIAEGLNLVMSKKDNV